MAGFFKRLFGGGSGEARPSSPLLSEEELSRIGTEEDLLRNYEAASERNFRAMEAEQRGEVDLAVSLYEQSVAEEFVEAHPYERLANLHEQHGRHAEAAQTLERFVELARSGRLPRGAQRSADRKLEAVRARAERHRKIAGG